MQIWTNITQGERKLGEAPGPISPNTAGPIWLFLMWIQWNNKLLDPFSFYWLGLSKLLILHQGRIASQFFIMSEKLLSTEFMHGITRDYLPAIPEVPVGIFRSTTPIFWGFLTSHLQCILRDAIWLGHLRIVIWLLCVKSKFSPNCLPNGVDIKRVP